MHKNIVCTLVFLVSTLVAFQAPASDYAIKITDIQLHKTYSPKVFSVIFFDSNNTWNRVLSSQEIPRDFQMEGVNFIPVILNYPSDKTYLQGRVCVMTQVGFFDFESFQSCETVKDVCQENAPCFISIEKSRATFKIKIDHKSAFRE